MAKRQEPNKLDVSIRIRKFDGVYGTLAPHQAVTESARCLFCYDAPCNQGCPAGIDVAGFIRNIKVKNFVGAARKLREKNILSAVCGYVCPAEKFCEAYCTSTQLDKPINIKALHRFAAEIELQRGVRVPESLPLNEKRVAVIGSGPSGLSCGVELRKLGYETTIFEELPVAGGLLSCSIPPHKLPKNIVQAELNYLVRMGLQFRLNCPTRVGSAIDDLFAQGYEAVFIGASLGKPLGLDILGEGLEGVYTWSEVLSWVNMQNAKSREENAVNLGKRAVVVGGGNVAINVATTALRLGAEVVYLVCLEAIDQMPAFKSEIGDALEEGVIIHPRAKVLSIMGTDGGKVCGVECIGIKWGEKNDFSPENVVPTAGTNFSLEVDSVVEAIGQSMDQGKNRFILTLEMKDGVIVVNPDTGQTSRDGVFAGGDIIRGAGTIVEALRDGVIAARGIDGYLRGLRD